MERAFQPAEIAADVARAAPAAADFQKDLESWVTAIPIPNWQAALPLSSSLIRVLDAVPWLEGALPREVSLGQLQLATKALESQGERFLTTESLNLKNLLSRYSVLGALVDTRPKPPSYIQQLRALSILAAFSWRAKPLDSVQNVLAQAIRAICRIQNHPLKAVLIGLGKAENPAQVADLLEAALPEVGASNEELAVQLERNFLTLLRQGTGKQTAEPASGGPPGPKAPCKIGVVSPQQKLPRKKSRKPRPPRVRRGLLREPIPPLSGESPEETATARTLICQVEERGKPVNFRKELFRARQSIWGSNDLIIRNHIESLSDPEAMVFASDLIARISRDLTEGRQDQVAIGVSVAMVFVSGSGADRVRSIKVHATGRGRTSSRVRPILMVSEGVLRIPVFRPENAFTPDRRESAYLQKVESFIDLALPPALTSIMKQSFEAGMVSSEPRPRKGFLRDIENYVREMRAPGLRANFSLARCRLTARARMQAVGSDLAATMLLCGDAFGGSTAPLYYACMSLSALDAIYKDAIWPLFGNHAAKSKKTDKPAYVGSELMATTVASRELARAVGGALHRKGKHESDPAEVARSHNSLINHTTSMVLVVGGHRPTNAIFELRRFDFDTQGLGGIFSDKQSDLMHMHRYSPGARILSDQLESLLSHYRALLRLEIDLPAKTRSRLEEALAGTSPLFFHLDPSLQLVDLKIQRWKESLPKGWEVLPLNWGRTYFASHGRQAGIPADFIAIYQGHLEAVGYPFSRESPTEPAAISRQMAPQLDLVARNGGWLCRNGLIRDEDKVEKLRELGVLKDWKEERRTLDDACKAFTQKQRNSARALLRSHRDAGNRLAQQALTMEFGDAVASTLLNSADTSRNRKLLPNAAAQPALTFSITKLESIQNRIDELSKTDAIQGLAAHNALHKILKNARTELGWACPVPGPMLTSASLEPTPFFPGMMRARMQVHAMREHFREIPCRPTPHSGFNEFEWANAITALSLCLYSFVDTPGACIAILEARKQATRSKTFKDMLLIPRQDESALVAGARGLAAVSLARLNNAWPTEPLPTKARINEVLGALLPAPLVGASSGDLLDRLCATIAINNRIELSGLARYSLNANDGSTDMAIYRQRQLIEEGSGTVRNGAQPAHQQNVLASEAPLPRKKRGQSFADARYGELSHILSISVGREKIFKLTGVTLSAANLVAFRNPLLKELEIFLQQDRLPPLVAALAAYALHLTRFGTVDEKEPAWSTVYKYITSFGRTLVDVAGSLAFLDLEEEDYAEIYLDVVDRLRLSKHIGVAAREIAHFHRYLVAFHDVQEMDLSEIDKLGKEQNSIVDAQVIQSREFMAGKQSMLISAGIIGDSKDTPDPMTSRLHRQALILSLLIRASGARMNEVASLRFKDIIATTDVTILLIRPSRYRRLKTSAARRLVNLTTQLSRKERQLVCDWVCAEHERLNLKCKPTSLIFGSLDDAKEPAGNFEMRSVIVEALRGPVGEHTRIHRLRHLVANEQLLRLWLSPGDWNAWRRMRASHHRYTGRQGLLDVVLPRDVRSFTLGFGHRRSTTTATCYFHSTWACTSRAAAALNGHAERHRGSVVLGVSLSGADKIHQRQKLLAKSGAEPVEPTIAWLTHLMGDVTETPGAKFESLASAPTKAVVLNGQRIEMVLRDIQRSTSPEKICLSYGLSSTQAATIKRVSKEVERRAAITIWPDSQSAKVQRQRRSARQFTASLSLVRLIDLIDEPGNDEDKTQLTTLAETYMTWATRKRDELLWPRREAERLRGLLVRKGFAEDQIHLTPQIADADFVSIRIYRGKNSNLLSNHILAWTLVVTYIASRI